MTRILRLPLFIFFLTAVGFLTAAPVAADLPGPVHWSVDVTCVGDGVSVHIVVDNFDITEMAMDVRRVESAPDMAGEVLLAADVAIPHGATQEFVLADPGLGAGEIGFYEVVMKYPGGSVYDTETVQRSCSAEPYLMRGYLVDTYLFAPCSGVGLLECDTVSLFYGDMNVHVGTGEMLDVYGWVETLNARDNCSVQVMRIEPLGAEARCEDAVGVTTATWSAVKAYYR